MQILRELTRLLDRARRFKAGQRFPPLWLRYQQTVSSRIWVVLIIGGTAVAPSNFTNQENWKTLFPVYLELDRRGQWLTPDPTNLVANGGFEDWTLGEPDDWTVDVGLTIEEETTIVHEGGSSLKVTGASAFDTGVTQDITVPVGATVKVSAWVYKTTGGRLGVKVDDGVSQTNADTLVTDVWQYVEIEYTPQVGGSDNVTVTVGGFAGTPSTGYIDDVRIIILDASGVAGDVATDDIVNGDIASLAFGSSEFFPSPTQVIVDDVLFGNNHSRAFAIVSNPGNIELVNAGALTMAAPFSQVTDTAAYARGNTILRFTPANTNPQTIEFFFYSLAGYQWRRVAVFANVRNNSTTTSYTARIVANIPGGVVTSKPVSIPAQATARPGWIFLGESPTQRDAAFSITLQASAAAGTLDIDEFVVIGLDDGSTQVVAIDTTTGVGASEKAQHVIINHNALTAPMPQVDISLGGFVTSWSARGAIAIYTQAAAVEGLLLATGTAASANTWRQVESAAAIVNTWTMSRLPGRLTPE